MPCQQCKLRRISVAQVQPQYHVRTWRWWGSAYHEINQTTRSGFDDRLVIRRRLRRYEDSTAASRNDLRSLLKLLIYEPRKNGHPGLPIIRVTLVRTPLSLGAGCADGLQLLLPANLQMLKKCTLYTTDARWPGREHLAISALSSFCGYQLPR